MPGTVEEYLRAAPKAELHLHLEGSIRPETLLKLAGHNRVALPATNVEDLRKWFTFRDFPHFVEIYSLIISCLRTSEDYELIVHELGAELARQNVRYAEVTFSASSHERRGIPFDLYFSALTRARKRVLDEFGVQINWVFDIVRDYRPESERARWADYTLGAAIEGMSDGVVALGLGGNERDYPASPYKPFFEKAHAAGLHSDPHAGETGGPESVWSALRDLGAERIGHGVRSIEDPALVAYLAEQRVPVEVCPTSNFQLAVFADAMAHPLRRLYEAGVPVTINSDDPPLFNATLNGEVALLNSAFGMSLEQIDDILLNGARYSFLPADRKTVLVDRFEKEMTVLRANYEL